MRDHRCRRAAELERTAFFRSGVARLMVKAPTPAEIATGLTVTQRVLLFCLASNTDWFKGSDVGASLTGVRRGVVRQHEDRRHNARGFQFCRRS
jgi:hypothetical protein